MKFKVKRLLSLVCLLLCACVMLSLCACSGKSGSESSADEASVTNASATEESTGSEDTTAEDTTATEDTTAADTTSATEETTAAQSETNSGVTVNSNGQEILGAGSKSQPYQEIPTSDMTVTTVSIPAGKALYYDIYRAGGKYMTIYSNDAYIIYNGTRYNASGGAVSLTVGSALASDAVSFQIGNAGSKAQSFTIYFSDPLGTWDNPEIIKKLDGKTITTSLAAGNDKGYNYEYVAEKSGTVRIYVKNELETYMLSATCVKASDVSVMLTFEADMKTDSTGNYIEFEVLKGETIKFNLSAYPKGFYYPAATINWYGKYV